MSDAFVYRDLETWQQAMALVEECYRVTTSFPRSEQYGLMSQMRRAACSIPSNVAEGHCRRSTKVYANHTSASPWDLTANWKRAWKLLFAFDFFQN
jgi:hypothetical protein